MRSLADPADRRDPVSCRGTSVLEFSARHSHTATTPGRFNSGSLTRPGFEILYFAEDHQVALFEVQALVGSPYPPAPSVPNPTAA